MFETSVHSPHSGADGTRERLLEAAGEVFAQKGFREATIRDICARAGANIAAVNYHFGGKERLYAEVLRYVDSMGTERHPLASPNPLDPPEVRLAWFIRQFLSRVFDTDRPAWHQRIMNREMVEPTFALEELCDNNIKKRSLILQGIVREFLGADATDQLVQRGAASVVGQCLFYWHCRPVICRIMPHIGFGPDSTASIAEHVTRFSISGLEGMRRELAREKNGGVA